MIGRRDNLRLALDIQPLTPERWDDFARLFGERGACGGCWCMLPLLTRQEFERGKGTGNRRAMKRLVTAGEVPGVLGYLDREPVAWCAIGPRKRYPQLARSRILAPVDDAPVWSIVCLFVDKRHRKQGRSSEMIGGAAAWARRQGARCVEGYPVDPRQARPPAFAWTGLASAFRAAGFSEVARRSAGRPIVRRLMRR